MHKMKQNRNGRERGRNVNRKGEKSKFVERKIKYIT